MNGEIGWLIQRPTKRSQMFSGEIEVQRAIWAAKNFFVGLCLDLFLALTATPEQKTQMPIRIKGISNQIQASTNA